MEDFITEKFILNHKYLMVFVCAVIAKNKSRKIHLICAVSIFLLFLTDYGP